MTVEDVSDRVHVRAQQLLKFSRVQGRAPESRTSARFKFSSKGLALVREPAGHLERGFGGVPTRKSHNVAASW